MTSLTPGESSGIRMLPPRPRSGPGRPCGLHPVDRRRKCEVSAGRCLEQPQRRLRSGDHRGSPPVATRCRPASALTAENQRLSPHLPTLSGRAEPPARRPASSARARASDEPPRGPLTTVRERAIFRSQFPASGSWSGARSPRPGTIRAEAIHQYPDVGSTAPTSDHDASDRRSGTAPRILFGRPAFPIVSTG